MFTALLLFVDSFTWSDRSFYHLAIVGTKRSYADVVRGTAGKNSSATDAVRQPAVNGKR
jgi:hypothetical protein